jgi:putative lipoprotein
VHFIRLIVRPAARIVLVAHSGVAVGAAVKRLNAASLLSAAVLLGGCAMTAAVPAGSGSAPAPVATARVTGTVTYLQRVALPRTAVVKVQLVDVSRADAPASVLGEQAIVAGGKQAPIAFEIAYDPAKIAGNHSYAVQARIEEDGRLRYINDRRHAVITRDAPKHVDLVLKAVEPR